MPTDHTRSFIPLNIQIITVSDTRTLATDRSGDTLENLTTSAGHCVAQRVLVRDEIPEIVAALSTGRDDKAIDVVITTGGTGITARDVTPEAFAHIVEKELSGFGEIFRQQSFMKIGTSAIQGRATAGISGATIFFILPGSPGACKDAWALIVEMLDNRYRPCNLNEMRERL